MILAIKRRAEMRMSTAGRLLSAAFVTAAFIGTGSGAGADLAGRPIWQYHASMMILAFLCLLSAAYLAVFGLAGTGSGGTG